VAKYCIQDCNLVHHLFRKVDVLTGYVEMSRICSVPISFLVFRGQGIKLTSYVAKVCRQRNTLMPELAKSQDADGYEGAIVLPPKCGMYLDNPVACVDYSSLYPSILISQNCSPDTLVWTREYDLTGTLVAEGGGFRYDNLPGYQYVDVSFDTFQWVRPHPKAKAQKVKSGTKTCRWAQFPGGRKGVLPEILKTLLQARADTREQAKQVTGDPFLANILDKRQLGYKVTANSLYGQCGSRTSTFYEKNVAAATTATGRMMITYAKRMVESIYRHLVVDTRCHGPVLTRAEYIYGDSVASYTPVWIRRRGVVSLLPIDRVAPESAWRRCEDPGRATKEAHVFGDDTETWTERGWTPLRSIVRHRLAESKRMLRFLTPTGVVDVTDDHSLVRADGSMVSPRDVTRGTALLHHDMPPFPEGPEGPEGGDSPEGPEAGDCPEVGAGPGSRGGLWRLLAPAAETLRVRLHRSLEFHEVLKREISARIAAAAGGAAPSNRQIFGALSAVVDRCGGRPETMTESGNPAAPGAVWRVDWESLVPS
jgi:hypothetical protein